jgi:hypothetical protein
MRFEIKTFFQGRSSLEIEELLLCTLSVFFAELGLGVPGCQSRCRGMKDPAMECIAG